MGKGYTMYYDSVIGRITLGERDGKVTHVLFGEVNIVGYDKAPSDTLFHLAKQLSEYFVGARKEFSLDITLEAKTAFSEKVLYTCMGIDYAQQITYGDLAKSIGDPNCSRAVGTALGTNNLAIIVPCHRVLSANGLGGYAWGKNIKTFLLRLEQQHKE